MKSLLSMIASVFLAATAFALPQQKAKITVSGYNWENAGELENFPVLVRISESRISGFYYDSCKEGGADISFALEDGTLLPHEIDTWNKSGESLVWVKVPRLVKDTTSFYLRWNDSTPPQNTPKDVWSSNYIGVWHMNSLNNKAVPDATGHGYDAALRGEGEITESSSKIGAVFKNGDNLDDNNAVKPGGLSVANYEPEFPGSAAAFTCSAWVYMPGADMTVNHSLMTKKTAWNDVNGWLVLLRGKESMVSFFATGQKELRTWGVKENNSSTFLQKWVYVTVTRLNGKAKLYVNGGKHHEDTKDLSAIVNASENPLILMPSKNTYMDECRLRNGGSTYDWIKAEYRTMADEAFLTYGEAEVSVVAENILVIDGSPNRFGTPTPGYGVVANLSPGSECNLSMSETDISVEGTSAKYCLKGWKLEKVEPLTGEVTLTKEYTPNSDDSLTSYTYTHSSMSQFTWLWDYRDELNLKNFNLLENSGTSAKFSVDVTGLGYSGTPASLKICYGLSSDEFLWEYDAGAVETLGVKEVTVPNLTPGVYYYMKAKIVGEGDSVVETAPIQVQMNEVEGATSPVSNLFLDGSGATTLSLSGSLDSLSGTAASITVLVGVSPEKMTSVWGELSGSKLTSAGIFRLTLNTDFEDEKYLAPGMTYYVQLLVQYSDGSAVVTTPTSVTMSKLTDGKWTYVETTTNADGSGSGTISDGIWKLPATRAKNVNELFVNAKSGTLASTLKESTAPLAMNFTAGAIDQNNNTYQIVSFQQFSHEKSDWGHQLRPYKDRLVEFIAPDCRSIPEQGTFLGCTKLTNVILKAGATLGQKNIFNACYSLRNIYPRVFTTLPEATFSGCSSLEGCIELTDQVNTFSIFSGCAKIEEIIAPKITIVSVNAFKGCASVTNITLSSSLTSIGESAFSGCSKLDADITKFVNNNLTSLGAKAFQGCSRLKGSLVWKNELITSLLESVFEGCSSLKSITFKSPITGISTKALLGLAPSSQIYFNCPAPTSFGEEGIMNNAPYTRVYLTEDFDNWLKVMFSHKNNYVAWKYEFSTLSTDSVARKRMLQDSSMCEIVDGKLKVLDRKVIGFLFWANGYGCWILKAPQTGFSVIVR